MKYMCATLCAFFAVTTLWLLRAEWEWMATAAANDALDTNHTQSVATEGKGGIVERRGLFTDVAQWPSKYSTLYKNK